MRLIRCDGGELRLYAPVFQALERSGQLPPGTRIACEVSVHGKYVDAVTLSPSGLLTAFEFKQRDSLRAVRQACLNQHYVDRSYVVLGTNPPQTSLELARGNGVGILYLDARGRLRRLTAAAAKPRRELPLRRQLAARVADVGSRLNDAL